MRVVQRAMSVDTAAASMSSLSLQSWLGQQLELRGIDAMVYTRPLLSILQQDTFDFEHPELELFLPKASARITRGRGRGRKPDRWSLDGEELKKTAAVECLRSALDEDAGIESFVEEALSKLKQQQGGLLALCTAASQPPSRKKKGTSTSRSEGYFDAFPALSDKADRNTLNVLKDPDETWSKRVASKSPGAVSAPELSCNATQSSPIDSLGEETANSPSPEAASKPNPCQKVSHKKKPRPYVVYRVKPPRNQSAQGKDEFDDYEDENDHVTIHHTAHSPNCDHAQCQRAREDILAILKQPLCHQQPQILSAPGEQFYSSMYSDECPGGLISKPDYSNLESHFSKRLYERQPSINVTELKKNCNQNEALTSSSDDITEELLAVTEELAVQKPAAEKLCGMEEAITAQVEEVTSNGKTSRFLPFILKRIAKESNLIGNFKFQRHDSSDEVKEEEEKILEVEDFRAVEGHVIIGDAVSDGSENPSEGFLEDGAVGGAYCENACSQTETAESTAHESSDGADTDSDVIFASIYDWIESCQAAKFSDDGFDDEVYDADDTDSQFSAIPEDAIGRSVLSSLEDETDQRNIETTSLDLESLLSLESLDWKLAETSPKGFMACCWVLSPSNNQSQIWKPLSAPSQPCSLPFAWNLPRFTPCRYWECASPIFPQLVDDSRSFRSPFVFASPLSFKTSFFFPWGYNVDGKSPWPVKSMYPLFKSMSPYSNEDFVPSPDLEASILKSLDLEPAEETAEDEDPFCAAIRRLVIDGDSDAVMEELLQTWRDFAVQEILTDALMYNYPELETVVQHEVTDANIYQLWEIPSDSFEPRHFLDSYKGSKFFPEKKALFEVNSDLSEDGQMYQLQHSQSFTGSINLLQSDNSAFTDPVPNRIPRVLSDSSLLSESTDLHRDLSDTSLSTKTVPVVHVKKLNLSPTQTCSPDPLFSPETHFRPIEPTSQKTSDTSSGSFKQPEPEANIIYSLEWIGGYQTYSGKEAVEPEDPLQTFVPKFKLVSENDKCLQTEIDAELKKNHNGELKNSYALEAVQEDALPLLNDLINEIEGFDDEPIAWVGSSNVPALSQALLGLDNVDGAEEKVCKYWSNFTEQCGLNNIAGSLGESLEYEKEPHCSVSDVPVETIVSEGLNALEKLFSESHSDPSEPEELHPQLLYGDFKQHDWKPSNESLLYSGDTSPWKPDDDAVVDDVFKSDKEDENSDEMPWKPKLESFLSNYECSSIWKTEAEAEKDDIWKTGSEPNLLSLDGDSRWRSSNDAVWTPYENLSRDYSRESSIYDNNVSGENQTWNSSTDAGSFGWNNCSLNEQLNISESNEWKAVGTETGTCFVEDVEQGFGIEAFSEILPEAEGHVDSEFKVSIEDVSLRERDEMKENLMHMWAADNAAHSQDNIWRSDGLGDLNRARLNWSHLPDWGNEDHSDLWSAGQHVTWSTAEYPSWSEDNDGHWIFPPSQIVKEEKEGHQQAVELSRDPKKCVQPPRALRSHESSPDEWDMSSWPLPGEDAESPKEFIKESSPEESSEMYIDDSGVFVDEGLPYSTGDKMFMMPTPPQGKILYSSELEEQWLGCDTNKKTPKSKNSKWAAKTKPCSFFLEGQCNRSDCRFAHDLSTITCRFWEKGECFKDFACPFLHGYPSGSSTPPHNETILSDEDQTSTQSKGTRRERPNRSRRSRKKSQNKNIGHLGNGGHQGRCQGQAQPQGQLKKDEK